MTSSQQKETDLRLDKLSKEQLASLECHYNWVCKFTGSSLKERIETVQTHIQQDDIKLLSQSYCLLAFLKSQNAETIEEVYGDLQKSLEILRKRIKEEKNEFLGYKAVILASMTYWETENLDDHTKALEHYNNYKAIESQINGFTLHPEVLAMKGFAIGYSFGTNSSRESAEAYEKALSQGEHIDRVSWLFGLAHARNFLTSDSEGLEEIEKIYRQIIELNPDYTLAMVKLGRILVKRGVVNGDEFEELIEKAEKVSKGSNNEVFILEEAGSIYRMIIEKKKVETERELIHSFNEKAKKKFKDALDLKQNSKNALKGLAESFLTDFHLMKNQGKEIKDNISKLLEAARIYEGFINRRENDELHLCRVYRELSLLDQAYFENANNLYKKACKTNDKSVKIKAYTYYSTFLKDHLRVREEIECLVKIIKIYPDENTRNDDRDRVSKAQKRLRKYLQNGKIQGSDYIMELLQKCEKNSLRMP